MDFEITRTSRPYLEPKDAEPPCAEARRVYCKLAAYSFGKARYKIKYKITINTLSELVELSRKYGEIIIDGDTLEIYDDYRE